MAVLAPNYGPSGRVGKMKKAVYGSYTPVGKEVYITTDGISFASKTPPTKVDLS